MRKTALLVSKVIECSFRFRRTRNAILYAPLKSALERKSYGRSSALNTGSSAIGYWFSRSKSFLLDRASFIGLAQIRTPVSDINFFNVRMNRLASTFVKQKTHYEVLKVSRSASTEEIREAFINLSKLWHPDKNTQDPTRHQKFALINEAYSTLSKPLSRRDYDLSLDAQRYVSRQMNASTSRTYGYEYSPNAGPYHHLSEAHYAQREKSASLMNFCILIACATFVTVSIILHYTYIPNPKYHHLRKDQSPEEIENYSLIMKSEQDGVIFYYYAVPRKDSKKVDIVVLRKSQDSSSEEPKMHEVTRLTS